jgi:hypothetical protein
MMELMTHYDSDSDSCDEDPFMGVVGVYERMLNKVLYERKSVIWTSNISVGQDGWSDT